MKKESFIIFLLFLLSFSSYAKQKKDIDPRIKKIEQLKEFLKDKQNELASTIENRWQKKQHYIEAREINKEKTEHLKQKQEQLFQEVTRKKEEKFSIENRMESVRNDFKTKKEEWKYTKKSFNELLEKEADKLKGSFPLQREAKQFELEYIRSNFLQNENPSYSIARYSEYINKHIYQNSKVISFNTPVMTGATDAENLQIIQFGNVSAYGKSPIGEIYTIRQTGRLGTQRFTIDSISNHQVAQNINQGFKDYSDKRTIFSLPFDVLQNNQSSSLIKSGNGNYSSKLKEFIKAGGPIMFPLLILPLWALLIAIIKLTQIMIKRKSGKQFCDKVLNLIRDGKSEEAYNLVKRTSGPIAKVIKTCLKHREWDRETSEKAVREIIVEEVPMLNKNMNTLAVLAAVAPLMGLLGTVSGMIGLFKVITLYGTGDPRIMAGGISEALITTQTGLTIAIPILLLHNFIQNRNNALHVDMEKSAIKVLNRLWIIN